MVHKLIYHKELFLYFCIFVFLYSKTMPIQNIQNARKRKSVALDTIDVAINSCMSTQALVLRELRAYRNLIKSNEHAVEIIERIDARCEASTDGGVTVLVSEGMFHDDKAEEIVTSSLVLDDFSMATHYSTIPVTGTATGQMGNFEFHLHPTEDQILSMFSTKKRESIMMDFIRDPRYSFIFDSSIPDKFKQTFSQTHSHTKSEKNNGVVHLEFTTCVHVCIMAYTEG
jgi:hypothetical protein